ncbi:30S ribosomal protein S11 [Candidatus Vidania fulgoroideae]|uniref:Small ribosomal subunit protein uS11 n=1 Tax=Candidatus Vidania fulgoroideorum TaxID=881286 RepID=A0A974X9E9_9PROT|nr:30S ribosomal protein S11 [Candidatus Vidania fulgoroideae]
MPKQPKKESYTINLIVSALCTYNNTIICLTDATGKILHWSSAGKIGFKGTKKSSNYAAQMATEEICTEILKRQTKKIKIKLKGPGPGRDIVIRTINNKGIYISEIEDTSPIPHNGCRPPKKRRT